MNSVKNEADLVANILKPCFRDADDVRIVKNFVGDDLDHFTSHILRVTVEYDQDGRTHRKDLVLKVPDPEARAYPLFEHMRWYDREISVYEKILPRVGQLLDVHLAPLHYHTAESRVLVLENVGGAGFEGGAKRQKLTLDECYVVLEALAKFHAVTREMRVRDPGLLDEPSYDTVLSMEGRVNLVDTWSPILVALLRRRDEHALAAKCAASLERLKDVDLYARLNHRNFDFVVLNHGDYRKDNMLFRYDEARRPKAVKLLDFQACVWCSPVFDVVYLLTMSTPLDVAERHFDALVDWYVTRLRAELRRVGCAQQYEKTDFMADFEKLRFFFLLSVVLTACINGPFEHDDIEDIFMLDREQKTRTYLECLDDEEFAKTVFGWLKYGEKLGVYDAPATS